MMGYISKYENEVTHRIIKENIEGKRDRGFPIRISFV
jgi:hypothetical protein